MALKEEFEYIGKIEREIQHFKRRLTVQYVTELFKSEDDSDAFTNH